MGVKGSKAETNSSSAKPQTSQANSYHERTGGQAKVHVSDEVPTSSQHGPKSTQNRVKILDRIRSWKMARRSHAHGSREGSKKAERLGGSKHHDSLDGPELLGIPPVRTKVPATSLLPPSSILARRTSGTGRSDSIESLPRDVQTGFLTPTPVVHDSTISEGYMSSTQLFNLFNDGYHTANIHDPNFILLIDTRRTTDYTAGHIVTARPAHSIAQEPTERVNAALHSFNVVVLYDTHGLVDSSTALVDLSALEKEAVAEAAAEVRDLAKEGTNLLPKPWNANLPSSLRPPSPTGSRRIAPLSLLRSQLAALKIDGYVLLGGYEEFSSRFPFLTTQLTILREDDRRTHIKSHPSIVFDNSLYLGRGLHAVDSAVMRNLHITHIINVSMEFPEKFSGEGSVRYLTFRLKDDKDADVLGKLEESNRFIRRALSASGRVLVHCNMGVSRSATIVLAYLMSQGPWDLRDAYDFLKECRSVVRPNRNFLFQLSNYEFRLYGRHYTAVERIIQSYGANSAQQQQQSQQPTAGTSGATATSHSQPGNRLPAAVRVGSPVKSLPHASTSVQAVDIQVS